MKIKNVKIKKVEIEIGGREHVFSGEDTRESVVAKLGAPDDVGLQVSKKDSRPAIYKYDETEFHFPGDVLQLIFRDNEYGVELAIPLCV